MPVLSTIGAMAARGFGWLYKATAAATSGKLFTWGANSFGQLGLGDTTDRSSPVQVGALTDWYQISGLGLLSAPNGSAALALKSDGSLWAWGDNAVGQLGSGNTTSRSSPAQVGALTTWATLTRGYSSSSFSIKTDGTLWAWGYNANGQLGLSDITNRSSPVQLGSATNWKQVSGSQEQGFALTTSGALYALGGANAAGGLGLGDTTARSSPVQIGALTTWSTIASGFQQAYALKTDGTLWAWGNNASGQLGLGDTTNRSSPVQVGALTTWQVVAASNLHALAIKTDGTLWSWGSNTLGQLGLGNTTDRSSPVQVGALTTWSQVTCGAQLSLAIKTDGTLWAWGSAANGQTGLGTTTVNYSSPVQVGALTSWIYCASSPRAGLAIQT